MREKVGRSLFTVAVQMFWLSSAPRDMMGLAVPERRKSASLVEFMKASCRAVGVEIAAAAAAAAPWAGRVEVEL